VLEVMTHHTTANNAQHAQQQQSQRSTRTALSNDDGEELDSAAQVGPACSAAALQRGAGQLASVHIRTLQLWCGLEGPSWSL
jgi:hypothetical protein